MRHASLQPSPEELLLSSHSSGPNSIKPSPQMLSVQSLLQISSCVVFASSHSSGGSSFGVPSPQNSLKQAALHPSPSSFAPSSHSSEPLTVPSPHDSSPHVALHPSLLSLLPSSQVSVPGFRKPSPQMLSRQLPVRQKSLSLILPSSHSSGGLSFGMPSPQNSF